MKIAVTGASGHVGGNLCRELIKQGHQVKALVHKDSRAIEELEIHRVKGDLSVPGSLDELCADVEVVFHLAALISVNGDRKRLEQINVQGTQNLVDAIKRSDVRRLIHFSSIHALDNYPLDKPMDENRPLVPNALMMYEATKAKGDQIVQDASSNGLEVVIVNPTAIIGPHDYKPSLIGQVLIKLYNRKLPALVPGGYDWVDVRDVVQASISAIENGKPGERYILSGKWISIKELAAILEGVTGKKMIQKMVPMSLAKIGVPFISAFSKITGQHPLYTFQSLDVLTNGNRQIVNDKARRDLDFNPRPIEKTLADSIKWYQQNGFIKVNNHHHK